MLCRAKLMYFFSRYILLAVLFGCACGAGTSTPTTGSETHFVTHVDIAGADTIFIGTQTGDNTRQLYKTVDGVVSLVEYFNVDGDKLILKDDLREMHDINENYLVLEFSDAELATTRLLVQKNNGSTYVIDRGTYAVPNNNFLRFKNANTILTDQDGSLYYIQGGQTADGNHRLAKVDISNPTAPTHQLLSPESEHVFYFGVGQDGLLLYDAEAPSRNVQRAVLPDGNLAAVPDWLYYYWKGASSLFATDNQDELFTMTTSDTGVIATPYATNIPVASGDLSTQITFPGRFLLVTDIAVVEIENPQNSPREIATPFDSIFDVLATDQHYYLSGAIGRDTNILQIDPENDADTISVLTDGAFEVGPMTIAADGRIQFEALRLEDKTEVVGLIDSNGDVEFVTENLFDGQLRTLIRLPPTSGQ